MTDEEADRIWNSPRCERCAAMETRLRAAMVANQSLKDGMDRAFGELAEAVRETKKLTSALADMAKLNKWAKA